jgi:hypothetical protein
VSVPHFQTLPRLLTQPVPICMLDPTSQYRPKFGSELNLLNHNLPNTYNRSHHNHNQRVHQ